MKRVVNHKYKIKDIYMVDENGNIYNTKRHKFIKQGVNQKGYVRVALACSDGVSRYFLLHRIIMESFFPIDNCEEMQINHIDGNKLNNSIYNLEWCTAKENIAHSIRTGLRIPKEQNGSKNHMAKLTEQNVLEIVELFRQGDKTHKEIANKYGVSAATIDLIKERRTWNHITKDIVF